MRCQMPPLAAPRTDPVPPPWHELQLPDTWPDAYRLRRPSHLAALLWRVISRRRPVQMPAELPLATPLPKYLQQDFHNMPNGFYSKQITEGYVKGFEAVMLGHMPAARAVMAGFLAGARAVLDLGTGSGSTAGFLRARGADDVWGLDPSPYQLQHAARQHPDVRFVQGLAEQLPFPDARFDAISVCFLFHELPPKFMRLCLRECRRVLRPGGRLAICEPAPTQLRQGYWRLFRAHGWRGPYYRYLAKRVHEPFVAAWHQLDPAAELRAAGFEPSADFEQFPSRHIQARVASI